MAEVDYSAAIWGTPTVPLPQTPGPEPTEQTDWGAAPKGAFGRAVQDRMPKAWGRTEMADFVRGLYDLPDAGAQLMVHAFETIAPKGSDFETWAKGQRELVDAINKQRGEEHTEMRGGEPVPEFSGPRLAGNMVGGAPLARLGATGPGATLGTRVLSGGASGGVGSAMTPVEGEGDFWTKKGEQVAVGTALGGALAPVTTGVATPNAQRLLRENISLTPGDVIGGPAKRVEDALTSIPLLGDTIKAAQYGAREDLNRAGINRSLAPIGERLPRDLRSGHAAIDYAYDRLGAAYENVLPHLRLRFDNQFGRDVVRLNGMAQNLEPGQYNQFRTILQNNVLRRFQNRTMDGQSLKEAESELGQIARSYRQSMMAGERNLGHAVEEVQGALRQLAQRTNPRYARRLREINQGYANFAISRKAAASQGASEGTYSPAQLDAAVRAKNATVEKSGYARGQALMQDLSGPARAVMSSRVPDSGTPTRALIGAGVLSASGAAGAYAIDPSVALALATAMGLYTRPGRVAVNSVLGRRPENIGSIAPYIAYGAATTEAKKEREK